MTRPTRTSNMSLIALVISLTGLSLLPFLLISTPPLIVVPWQAQLVGVLFALICGLGIIAGVSPRHCSFSSRPHRTMAEESKQDPHPPSLVNIHKRGHHPTCESYAGHILKLNSRTLCAGCTGLVTGAVVAIFGTVLFFFFEWRFYDPWVVFWIGFVFVAFGLLQHPIYQMLAVNQSITRFIVNILFVLGPFLLLASLIQISNNLTMVFYMLLLTLYWIFTRITMSRRSHQLICRPCAESTCVLREG